MSRRAPLALVAVALLAACSSEASGQEAAPGTTVPAASTSVPTSSSTSPSTTSVAVSTSTATATSTATSATVAGSTPSSTSSSSTSLPVPSARPADFLGEEVIGTSAGGRPITVSHRGTPGGTVVLVVGVIHGTEDAGLAVLDRLATMPLPAGIELWLMPAMNPDG